MSICRISMVLAAILFCASASAQFPARPIKFVVPFPPGSATDTITRILAQPLSNSLGQPVLVENVPGADGAIAAVKVMKSPLDGHTLLMSTATALTGVPTLRKQPPYDPLTDFSPVSFVGNYTFFLVVNSTLPIKTLGELIAYAKANPRKLNYASGNATGIVAMGQLVSLTGIEMVHVPYKGEPAAVPDLVAGRVDLMFATPTTTLMFVKQGKLRALATTNRTRSPLAPDTPTMAEAGLSKLSFAPWGGVFGPAGLPKEVADRLSREIAAAFQRPEVSEAIEKQALEFAASTPEELAAFLKEQLEVWRGVVRELNIQRD